MHKYYILFTHGWSENGDGIIIEYDFSINDIEDLKKAIKEKTNIKPYKILSINKL